MNTINQLLSDARSETATIQNSGNDYFLWNELIVEYLEYKPNFDEEEWGVLVKYLSDFALNLVGGMTGHIFMHNMYAIFDLGEYVSDVQLFCLNDMLDNPDYSLISLEDYIDTSRVVNIDEYASDKTKTRIVSVFKYSERVINRHTRRLNSPNNISVTQDEQGNYCVKAWVLTDVIQIDSIHRLTKLAMSHDVRINKYSSILPTITINQDNADLLDSSVLYNHGTMMDGVYNA